MKIKKRIAIIIDNFTEYIRKKISPIRRKKITDKLFTIISNNCWGGKIYQRYGLPYLSPTIGLYFFSEDYIKFLKDLKYYMELPLEMIPVEESKYYEILKKRKQLSCPIGKLDDIEIIFQHYKTDEEAKDKWERRKKRINWENLIIKFSQMNYCDIKYLTEFDNLNYDIKFAFVNTKELTNIGKSMIYFKGFEDKPEIRNDTDKYCKFIDTNYLINNKKVRNRKTKLLR